MATAVWASGSLNTGSFSGAFVSHGESEVNDNGNDRGCSDASVATGRLDVGPGDLPPTDSKLYSLPSPTSSHLPRSVNDALKRWIVRSCVRRSVPYQSARINKEGNGGGGGLNFAIELSSQSKEGVLSCLR